MYYEATCEVCGEGHNGCDYGYCSPYCSTDCADILWAAEAGQERYMWQWTKLPVGTPPENPRPEEGFCLDVCREDEDIVADQETLSMCFAYCLEGSDGVEEFLRKRKG